MPNAPSRTSLAEDHRDDGSAQADHLAEVEGNRFSDVAFLGLDPGEGPGGVDESDDRELEFFREPHEAERLAVALRMVVRKFLFRFSRVSRPF